MGAPRKHLQQSGRRLSRRDRLPVWAAAGLAGTLAAFFILPLAALVWRAAQLTAGQVPGDLSIGSAVVLSLSTTAATAALCLLLGTPLAYFLARARFRFKPLLTVLVELPIVMPPVVAGLALLSAFGRRGLLGAALAGAGISLPFTFTAVVLAQLFVSAPFYIRAAQSRFESVPREYEDAAAVDGASPWTTFWQVILPQSSRALLTGLILAWARALGEFGATILFAGSLPGRTQTMPLLVYAALERDLGATFITALILLGLAVLAFTLIRWLAGDDGDEDEFVSLM